MGESFWSCVHTIITELKYIEFRECRKRRQKKDTGPREQIKTQMETENNIVWRNEIKNTQKVKLKAFNVCWDITFLLYLCNECILFTDW